MVFLEKKKKKPQNGVSLCWEVAIADIFTNYGNYKSGYIFLKYHLTEFDCDISYQHVKRFWENRTMHDNKILNYYKFVLNILC